MYSIAHIILKPEFGRSWQEAVAIVQEVASLAHGLQSIPPIQDLSLTDEGTVVMGFASEEISHPVTTLAGLLLALLEGTDAPPALRALAEENARTPPAHADLASFSRAVGFFERPGREHVLAGLASRLRAEGNGGVEANQEQELEKLRAKVASHDEGSRKNDAARSATRGGTVPARRRPIVAAGLVLLAVVAMAAWQGPALVENVKRAVAAPLPDIELAVSPDPDVAKTTRPRAVRRATPPVGSRPRPAGPSASPIAPEALALVPSERLRDSTISSVFVATDPRPVGTVGPGLHRVYSAADRQVDPPVLVRRQLPTSLKPAPDAGHFDIVVDETGRVEQVRLTSPTRGYHERMLVAAAKAWLFEPARLDGYPVRFQVRIPITITREW